MLSRQSSLYRNGWHGKVQISPQPVNNDQFQPAIDYAPNGDWMVNFYDRSQDSGNLLYHERCVRLSSSGTILDSAFLTTVAANPYDNTWHWIGDYQDIWYWGYHDTHGPRFSPVFAHGEPQGDIYVAGVN